MVIKELEKLEPTTSGGFSIDPNHLRSQYSQMYNPLLNNSTLAPPEYSPLRQKKDSPLR